MEQDQMRIEPPTARIPPNCWSSGGLAVWKGRNKAHSGAVLPSLSGKTGCSQVSLALSHRLPYF